MASAIPSQKFYIATLGCKVNQYESESIREAWLRAGHQELTSPEGADLALINSCAITARAIGDLRALVRRIRRLSPNCELLIAGCAAQALPEELRSLSADALIPAQAKAELLLRLPQISQSHQTGQVCQDTQADQPSPTGPMEKSKMDFFTKTPVFPPFSINGSARSRAILKIHDGCSRHCAYCIVPLSRGPSASRPWPAILAEADRLIRAGFREITLNGVNLGQYGADFTRPEDFWDLLIRLEAAFAESPEANNPEVQGVKQLRFRLSSLDPGQLTLKALSTLIHSSLIAPHLHLSLQSGSPRILRRMSRGYSLENLPDFLNRLRKIWPVFGLGADFIVGFPGENEADFRATLDLVEDLPLTYAHVFPYSRRPGTPAAHFQDQTVPEVKKERAARLRQLVDAKKAAFLNAQLSLPHVFVALEEDRLRGMNEFYTDCQFSHAPPSGGKTLILARPVRVQGNGLLVEAV